MRDLIVGCSTNYSWEQLKYWVNSINKSGFQGEKVLILMNCDKYTVQKVIDSDFKVIGLKKDESGNLKYDSNLPVHVERFFHIYFYFLLFYFRNKGFKIIFIKFFKFIT